MKNQRNERARNHNLKKQKIKKMKQHGKQHAKGKCGVHWQLKSVFAIFLKTDFPNKKSQSHFQLHQSSCSHLFAGWGLCCSHTSSKPSVPSSSFEKSPTAPLFSTKVTHDGGGKFSSPNFLPFGGDFSFRHAEHKLLES